MDNFVSLHTHSENSILDGFGSVKEYIEVAKELGQTALGITDHGSLGGIYSLIIDSEKAGITPIPGCEFYMAPENPLGAKVQEPVFYGPGGKKVPGKDVSGNGAYTHMTVWAYNRTGLQNLYLLSSLSGELENTYSKPRIDFDMLAEHSDGLIAATGCPSSEISTRFRLGQTEKAYDHARRLLEVFGNDRLFVEIMDHSMESDLERNLIPQQLKLAEDLGLELLATNDAHYARASDAKHHEEMLAIQSKSRMSENPLSEGGSRFAFQGDQYYMPTAEHMLKIFPEDKFPRAVSNTVKVAEMCSGLSLTFDPSLRPVPMRIEGETEVQTFKRLVQEGFKRRYGKSSPEVIEQAKKNIKKELEVFISSDFVGYMLTVYEYIDWAQRVFSTRDDDGNILALSTGVGRGCFMPGSLVRNSNGHKTKIENIKVGSKVRTHDATYHEVEKVHIYEVEDESMMRLTLSNGNVIECTSDHMIFHKDRGFTRADQITTGMTLLGPKGNKKNFEYPCDSCGASISVCKRELDNRSAKGEYKPVGEYFCYDCVKSNLHAIKAVRSGSIKGAMRSKEESVKLKNAEGVRRNWRENREVRMEQIRRYRDTDAFENYRENCRVRSLARCSDPEELLKLANQGKGNYKNGYFTSHQQGGASIYYASSFELKALNIFETDSNVASFDRCKRRIPYTKSSTGLTHNYLPDFEVVYKDGTRKIIEVKASWQTREEETHEKLLQASEKIEDEGITFEVWTEDELALQNDAWHNDFEVVNAEPFTYTGKVYDLQVEGVHNYTVSDVTVHNSVGGSTVAYVLGISETDPIRYDLIFERFLSAGRGSVYGITLDSGETIEAVASDVLKVKRNGEEISIYAHQIQKDDEVLEVS